MKLKQLHAQISFYSIIIGCETYGNYDYFIETFNSIDHPLTTGSTSYPSTLRDLLRAFKDEEFIEQFRYGYLDIDSEEGQVFYTALGERLSIPCMNTMSQIANQYLPEDSYSLNEVSVHPVYIEDFVL